MVPAMTPIELAELIREHHEMTVRLQASYDQLQETVRGLRRELAEKDQALLRKSRLAALGEMAAGVAHEIRNPLGGIELFASLLGRELEAEPQRRRLVGKVLDGVGMINEIIEGLLAYTGEVQPAFEDISLARICDEALSFSLQLFAPAGVRYRRDYRAGLAPARLDPGMARRVVMNLVRNAVQASPPGTEVVVQLRGFKRAGRDGQLLRILDRGRGIPSEHLDKIFNPFFSLNEGGVGLGLSIVHRMVEAHAGQVGARRRRGGGTVVSVFWPDAEASAPRIGESEAA